MTFDEHHILQQLIGLEGVARGLTRWWFHGKDSKVLRCLDEMSKQIENVRPDIEGMMRNGKPNRELQQE
jgi:hypothetical protein